MATSSSILAIGLSLMVVGTAAWLRLAGAGGGVIVAVAALSVAGAGLASTADDPCHVETVYHCARVLVDEDRPGGRLLMLDNLRHSYVDLDDPTYLEFRYSKAFADVLEAAAPAGPLDALHIGGGGFTCCPAT